MAYALFLCTVVYNTLVVCMYIEQLLLLECCVVKQKPHVYRAAATVGVLCRKAETTCTVVSTVDVA